MSCESRYQSDTYFSGIHLWKYFENLFLLEFPTLAYLFYGDLDPGDSPKNSKKNINWNADITPIRKL